MTRTLAIGIDGGGTTTRAVVESEAGVVIGRGESGPSNPHAVGVEVAVRNVASAVLLALRSAAQPRSAVSLLALGAAGLGDPAMRRRLRLELARSFSEVSLFVTTDADLALAATGGSAIANRVVAVIAGTGSIAMARGAKGTLARAGGFGFRIGDDGSGAWIAREALALAQRSLEGRAPRTRLVDSLCRALDTDREGLRVAAHRAADSAAGLASLAPIVLATAKSGDRAAREILVEAGSRLADLATCVIRRAGLARAPDRVSLSRYGGIFAKMPPVDRAFRKRLVDRTGVSPIPPRVPCEIAAIELARLEFAIRSTRR